MLTPQDITNTTLKSGMGYKKKEVEAFLLEVQKSFLELYKENEELKEKASVLSEGVQYYKNLEKTLQKSLVLAEKTSNETITTAEAKARAIEQEAKTKANMMLNDAQKELNQIHNQIISLIQQYEKYKTQCKQFASTQLELLDSSSYDLKIPSLDELISPTTESSVNINIEKEKKKISFDLKEDNIDSVHFFKNNEATKMNEEKVEISKTPEVSIQITNGEKDNITQEIQRNVDMRNITYVESRDTDVRNIVYTTSENMDAKSVSYAAQKSTNEQSNVQSNTQPLPEVKEIFMNARKEEDSNKKEVVLPNVEQRTAAKEAGFSFSDEEETTNKDFSEMTMNNHNNTSKKEDMEINDVLSKLKKSFK